MINNCKVRSNLKRLCSWLAVAVVFDLGFYMCISLQQVYIINW